jgi:hypothetical protein
VVNSSQGGGSKDTWVLFGNHDAEPEPEPAADQTQVVSMNDLSFEQSPSPEANGAFGFRSQQGQQQQGPPAAASVQKQPTGVGLDGRGEESAC